jgi:cytosine/adenosine deaminase-related metal-dependent hydrolase
MRYLSAHYVFPVSSPPLKNGIVCVNDCGYIADVTDTGGKLKECEKLEFYSGILVPGFVNAHCHLELSHLRNAIEPHCSLPAFVSSIGSMRTANFETITTAAKEADEEMVRNGIVAVGDISNSDYTLEVKKNSVIRYHTFVELFGMDGSRAKEIITAGQRTKQLFNEAGLDASQAPHAIYSVSSELWEMLYQSYTSSPPQVISIHHQESNDVQNSRIRELKSSRIEELENQESKIKNQMFRCFQEASRCLLVHNVFSTKDDLTQYASDSKKYYFVLCPRSNIFIQSRLPDIQLFASPELSNNTCLGTDSLASNTNLSILEEMKIIQQHYPGISLETLLQWATINGARALGIDSYFGNFAKGKTPGVNLITGIDFERMRLTDASAVKNLKPSHLN